jgi:hypothetical protein
VVFACANKTHRSHLNRNVARAYLVGEPRLRVGVLASDGASGGVTDHARHLVRLGHRHGDAEREDRIDEAMAVADSTQSQ